jgi:lipoprotein signal peptidase
VTPRRLGVLIAGAVVVVDQLAKAAVLRNLSGDGLTPFAPFLDLTLRWNTGISFSLFAGSASAGRTLLLLFTLAAIVLLGVWLYRCRSLLVAVGLGCIIGGAAGNALDRIVHGAVVDYLDLHAFGTHFFVFNLADAAINVGVLILILDAAFGTRSKSAGNQTVTPPGVQ